MSIKEHKKILAAVFFVFGVLDLVAWIAVGGFYGGEWWLFGYGILFLLTGFKIHNQTKGAKIFAIISSILLIPAFPIGTVIGIYGFWIFLMRAKRNC